MSKTFDLDDPAQYLAYLEHTALQVLLYGSSLYLSFNGPVVTVHDARDITIRQPGQVPEGHPDASHPVGWGEHPRTCNCGQCP